MGRGCNRLSLKMKRRKSWRAKKNKLKAKIAGKTPATTAAASKTRATKKG